MRVIREINHRHFKITIFAWNNRYLIKLEQGLLEQTYKINQTDIAGEEDLLALLDEKFMATANELFQQMNRNLVESQSRSGY